MIMKESIDHTDKVRITFMLPASFWADSIHLVGDFNRWNPTATPLRLDDTGWSVVLELDAGREYQYQYLVDGMERLNDCHADRYEAWPSGVETSVLVTGITIQQLFCDEDGQGRGAITPRENEELPRTNDTHSGWQRMERLAQRTGE